MPVCLKFLKTNQVNVCTKSVNGKLLWNVERKWKMVFSFLTNIYSSIYNVLALLCYKVMGLRLPIHTFSISETHDLFLLLFQVSHT